MISTNAMLKARGNPLAIALSPNRIKAYIAAWSLACIFYFIEYAVRSSPAVMLQELATSFGATILGAGAIIATYYYTYSVMSLVAGAALDRFGAKVSLPIGIVMLAIGSLLFAVPGSVAGNIGRLLQGAGSAFAFTGAVYLAVHGFSARRLATAIGVTQLVGMLGGSAGQLVVGSAIHSFVGWRSYWIIAGSVSILLALLMFLVAPDERVTEQPSGGLGTSLLRPFMIVLSNPQSYLCGGIAGLLFAPTTIGDMVWAVRLLQSDCGLTYHQAVTNAAMVPLGWVIGSPLFGWLSDKLGQRKPVLFGGIGLMLICLLQLAYFPHLLSPTLNMLLFGISSGVAMIPYTIMKEANPPEVKGSATGSMNFLTFGATALLAPLFANGFGANQSSSGHTHFDHTLIFWVMCCATAGLLTLLLKETGVRPANSVA